MWTLLKDLEEAAKEHDTGSVLTSLLLVVSHNSIMVMVAVQSC